MRVGVIGTGVIGGRMAQCLIAAGHEVAVHDLRREAAAEACARGARWADDPRAIAGASEVVFTSLPGPAQVEAVVLEPGRGLLSTLGAAQVWVDTTTNSPAVFRRLAQACAERGAAALDAPLSGLPPESTWMVGGDAATLERCRPLFQAMGRRVVHMGIPGNGCIAKLVTQYMGYANFIAAAEAMLIGLKAGVDLRALAEAAPHTVAQSRTLGILPRSVFDGSYSANGTLDALAKDMGLACELAAQVESPAGMGEAVRELLTRAQSLGWGQLGYPNVVRLLEERAGAALRAAQP